MGECRSSGGQLCYFLVCFQNQTYVRDLLSALYREDDLFLVHCDPKAPTRLKRYLEALESLFPNIFLLEPQPYSWAGFSHVSVSFRAMEIALMTSSNWHHFIFLSEQHLPLRHPDKFSRELTPGRSMFFSIAARDYYPSARADVLNRFALVYRELPGVGCFATAIREDAASHFESARHSSNWIVLHRDHCAILVARAGEGALSLYESVVHAEELAIATLLADHLPAIENRDNLLVAAPHLTDNHSLIMTDELFLTAINSDQFFIRKRTKLLSERVRQHIVFNPYLDIEIPPFIEDSVALAHDKRKRYADLIAALLVKRFNGKASLANLDPADHQPSPAFHAVVRHVRMPANTAVRILSEDFENFKILIVKEENFSGLFAIPTIADGCLHSTLRVRIYGLFGNTDVLPLDLPDAGFVGKEANDRCAQLLGAITQCIDCAIASAEPIL